MGSSLSGSQSETSRGSVYESIIPGDMAMARLPRVSGVAIKEGLFGLAVDRQTLPRERGRGNCKTLLQN